MSNPTTVSSARTQRQAFATFAQARAAKATDKPQVLRFGNGVYLWVTPNGTKSWRCKYRSKGGKQTTVVLGRFPEMAPSAAQTARAAIREQVRKGDNPKAVLREAVETRLAGEANTLRAVAELWAERARAKTNWTDAFDAAMRSRLDRLVYPKLGNLPVASITMEQVEELIFALHKRRPATATCIKQYLGRIFDYALRHRLVPFNPVRQVAPDLPSHTSGRRRHQPHVRTIGQARAVLAAFEFPPALRRRALMPWMLLCHRLIALTAVRKNEAVNARWDEVDLDRGLWTIPAERMKGKADRRRAHVVALSPQAIEVFQVARRIRCSEYVFHSPASRLGRMNTTSMNGAMDRVLEDAELGPVHTPHGWRHTFTTIMAEANFRDRPVIDGMLAHKPLGASHTALVYDHSELIEDRRRVACAWADLLMQGAPSPLALVGLDPEAVPASNVVRLPRRVA